MKQCFYLRTETAWMRADAALESYRDNYATYYIYVAEAGVCDICADLDGIAVPVERAERGANLYPMRPNCRCSSHGHIEMEYKDGKSTLDEFKVWESQSVENDGIVCSNEPAHLYNRFDYIFEGKKGLFLKGSEFKTIKTIAGKGGKDELRIADKLSRKFGGAPEYWKKKVGKIESELYIFDMHWYEFNGDSTKFEMKIKLRKDRR